MTEVFLHYLFDSRKLGQSFKTVEGQNLKVINFGYLNHSSGPDFLEGQIEFDDKRWAGHIEFHLNSSDWYKHGHQHDEGYRNVIAHFVYKHDKEVYIHDFKLPVVELKDQIDSKEFEKYERLMASKLWIPCQNLIKNVDKELIQSQLEEAFDARMKRKTDLILQLLVEHKGDLKRVFYILLARSLGGVHNAVSMEKLLLLVDFQLIARLNFSPPKVAAYLEALAGFEGDIQEHALIKSSGLNPMSKSEWKTYGMRPPSQPRPRIRQLAELLTKVNELNKIELGQMGPFLELSAAPPFSSSLKDRLTINVIVPFLAAKSGTGALQHLARLKPESNKVVENWSKLGVQAESAKISQALLEQKNEYCNGKKCLFCRIGKSLLKE